MKKTFINLLFVASMLSLVGCSDGKRTLYVFSWSDYFEPSLVERFERENNCKVSITSFDSNEAMYAKLKAGGNGYDILVPSSYLIPLLIRDGLVMKLDHSMLTNVVSNFDHSLDGQVLDSNLEYSVPYACSYTGIMYLRDKVSDEDVRSWAVFSNPKYDKKMSLLEDIREVVGIGLMYGGNSLNSSDEDEIMDAARTISKWRKGIRKFDSESYKNEISSGSMWIGHGYSADAAQVIIGEGRSDIGFALPDDGFTIAWDELVVSSESENVELSHRFIDFLYDNEVSYSNMLYICSLTGNSDSISRIPDEYRNFMLPKNIGKGQLLMGFENASVNEIYNSAYDLIKSNKENKQ